MTEIARSGPLVIGVVLFALFALLLLVLGFARLLRLLPLARLALVGGRAVDVGED